MPTETKLPMRYFIKRNGYWYRPGASGYTPSLAYAGLYSEDEAKSREDAAAGVSIHPLSEVIGELDAEIRSHEGHLAVLKELREIYQPRAEQDNG